MTTMTRIAPVTKSIRVRSTPARAFEVFTTSLITWWPPGYTIGTSPMREVVIEPRVGGRWYEVGEDGSECQWGDVLAWNPPTRLLLAWRIGLDWKFDPALLTEVDVRFADVGKGETEVTIEHSKFENFGADAEQAIQIFDGWSSTLVRFANAVHGLPQPTE